MNEFTRNLDKRFSPDGNQNYDIKKVWDHHHEISRLLTAGVRPLEIAKRLNITPQTVSNVRNNPVMQRLMQIMHVARDADAADVQKKILEIAPVAVEYLETAMRQGLDNDTFNSVGLGAAKTVIETSVPKTTYIETQASIVTQIITDVKERAKATCLLQAAAADAEFTEVVESEVSDES